MGKVLLDVTMSLDGFMAGPNVSVKQPMGEGGARLHHWMFQTPPSEVDAGVQREMVETTGAVVLGRRTFDVGLGEWGDTPFPAPCFVVTHRGQPDLPMKSGTFTFVTDGIENAVRQAQAVAGDKYIRLMGADIAQQCLQSRLVDELSIQFVPLLMSDGRRLFDQLGTQQIELERTRVMESPHVTHLRFRVIK